MERHDDTSAASSAFASSRVRILVYMLAFLGFGIFFTVILSNKESRYNRRMEQMDTRRSTRMSMMRENYLRADSVFREEQKRMDAQSKDSGRTP
ncbi:MAG: hypothetical protein ACKOB6_05770 [Candidatus Kapaibacterium sp.]